MTGVKTKENKAPHHGFNQIPIFVNLNKVKLFKVLFLLVSIFIFQKASAQEFSFNGGLARDFKNGVGGYRIGGVYSSIEADSEDFGFVSAMEYTKYNEFGTITSYQSGAVAIMGTYLIRFGEKLTLRPEAGIGAAFVFTKAPGGSFADGNGTDATLFVRMGGALQYALTDGFFLRPISLAYDLKIGGGQTDTAWMGQGSLLGISTGFGFTFF